MRSDYDYIITGGGCAGLSLLFRFHKDPYFQHKKILVIDAVEKKQNDRTWCFWEKESGIFEPIVHHSWDQIEFLGYQFKLTTSILPYQYKMIKGIDFYNYIQKETNGAPNISWLQAEVTKIYTDKNGLATVECGSKRITSQFIFNSIIFEKPILQKYQYYFLQHFV
ncbi:MAG: lycopene cyclase family protein, partial [Sediminibacterium sp.]